MPQTTRQRVTALKTDARCAPDTILRGPPPVDRHGNPAQAVFLGAERVWLPQKPSQMPCPAGSTPRVASADGKTTRWRCVSPDGTEHGPQIAWWSAPHTPKRIARLHRGQRDGLDCRFYANGSRQSVTAWSAGRRDGRSSHWGERGQPTESGAFAAGKRDGSWLLWWPEPGAGPRKLVTYRRGVRHGAYAEWHKGGSLAYQGRFEEGDEAGVWRAWYANGQARWAGRMRAGERTGKWQRWHDNGQLWTVCGYKAGKKHGGWKMWSRSGEPVEQGEYARGKKAGHWTRWRKDGSVASKQTYPPRKAATP